MISILVADDEAPARDELAFLLGEDERVGEIHRASSGAEALRILSQIPVDAVFLDIHMPGLSGFDLARTLGRFEKRPTLVFVTADDEGAVDAFDLDAVDYVLKPVRRERLDRAVTRVIESRSLGSSQPTEDSKALIAVTLGSTTRMIRRSDVRFAQAQGDYVRLHSDDASYLVRVPLADLATQWAAAGFVRIHRSYLVSLGSVSRMRLSAEHPTVTVNLGGAAVDLPVSRRLLPTLRERIAHSKPRANA